MRQRRIRSLDPECHDRKSISTSEIRESNVGKYWLCSFMRRVSFQTRSIGLSSGLYGGKYAIRNLSPDFLRQSECSIAWWYFALSIINATLRPEWHAALLIFFKKSHVEPALKLPVSWAKMNFPSRSLTAPKYPTPFRVGCCKTTGFFSSGATHIRQRVPCCWKWTSSTAHMSYPSAWSSASFFILLLLFRICFRALRTRFAKMKIKLPEDSLALTRAQLDIFLFAKPMRKTFSVPYCAIQTGILWAFPQYLIDFFYDLRGKATWSSRIWGVVKPGQSQAVISFHPTLNRPNGIPQQFGNLFTAHFLGNHENRMDSVLVAGSGIAPNLILKNHYTRFWTFYSKHVYLHNCVYGVIYHAL